MGLAAAKDDQVAGRDFLAGNDYRRLAGMRLKEDRRPRRVVGKACNPRKIVTASLQTDQGKVDVRRASVKSAFPVNDDVGFHGSKSGLILVGFGKRQISTYRHLVAPFAPI